MENVYVLTFKLTFKFEFLNWLRDTNRSQATSEAYVMDVEGFMTWFEAENREKFEPDLLNGPDLRAYARMAKGSMRAATWNRKRSALRVFCTWAMLAGYIKFDPFEDMPMARPDELPIRWLSDPEYHRLLRQMEISVNMATSAHDQAEALRNRAITALGLYAGLREAEMAALTLADIQIGERSGRLVIGHGKGDKRRELPMGKELRLALSRWLMVRGEEPGLLVGVGTRQIQRIVGELGRLAKIEHLTPHDLRHTYIKRLIRSGYDLVMVARLAGHSRIETTKRYCQPGWEDLNAAVEEM